jgi:hypothetical protein
MTQDLKRPQRGRQFDLEIVQSISAEDLDWPWGAESVDEGLGWNRDYWRLPKLGWGLVRETIDAERQVIDRLSASSDQERAYDEWCLARQDGEAECLIGLDLGTNALVAALRAGRSLPYYSCNGGAFGSDHHAPQPVIAFLCRAELLHFIVDAARASDVGLVSNNMDGATAFACNVDAFIDMADELFRLRKVMGEVRLTPITRRASGAQVFAELDRQLTLF